MLRRFGGTLVGVDGFAGAARHAHVFDHLLDVQGRSRGDPGDPEGHDEVQRRTYGADTLRVDVEEPEAHVEELGSDDVEGGEAQTDDHTGDGALPVHPLIKDTEDDDREETGRRETEGEGHHLGHEPGWVDAEVSRNYDRTQDHQTAHEQAFTLTCRRVNQLVVDVMG